MKTNVLYYGDNLEVIHKHIPDDSIDLIYIDPPFFSSKAYEIIYGDTKEKRMFEDRWKGDVYHYVNWMEPRLAQMHRVLKPTGSIYVHLDWHAVHYIKVAMDKIFGYENLINDIVWFYRTGGASKRYFARKHDNILWYAKGKKWTFNPRKEKSYMMHKYGFKKSNFQEDEHGQYSMVYLRDVWDIPSVGSATSERFGYPTQKPERLLTRIIDSASNPGDIVADFFCGCGTTLAVAQLLGRKWIGCDVSPTALKLVKQRLIKYGATDVTEVGVPKSLADLKAMKPFEFQNYIISFIQGVHNPKLVAEGGIDGWTVFKRHPLQVKQQEHVGRPEIQKFQSAIHAEKKDKGYFFAFSFTKPAYEEAARCKQEEGIEIEFWEIKDLMKADPPPTFL
jgi:DNA modification methylase